MLVNIYNILMVLAVGSDRGFPYDTSVIQSVVFVHFFIFLLLLPCGRLSWLAVSFWAHVNITS